MASTTRGDHRGQITRPRTSYPDEDSRERPLILYTDGSGIEGRIRAAAIVDLEDQHAHSQMGGNDTSTVYAAELRAIEMALTLVLESTGPWAKQVKNRLSHLCRQPSGAEGAPSTPDAVWTGLSGRLP